MIKAFAATTIFTSILLSFGTITHADHLPQPSFNKAETINLLRVIQSKGVYIVIDDEQRCKENVYGSAMMSLDAQRQYLIICASNHGNNLEELGDTIRHEAIHVAQHCQARQQKSKRNLPLFPQHTDKMIAIAASRYHMPLHQYSREDWPTEAEARVGARILNENQIATLVQEECS